MGCDPMTVTITAIRAAPTARIAVKKAEPAFR